MRIAYRDEGEGRPLVLLHGLMAHGGFFREQAPLADAFRLIAIDLRGHGASARPGERPTVEQVAADVAGLADALGLEGAIGVGWSMGATILWHVLTGPAAARFAGAVSIDMTARVLNDEDWGLGLSPQACEARTAAIRDDFASFAAAAGQAIFARPVAGGRGRLAHPTARRRWGSGRSARIVEERDASPAQRAIREVKELTDQPFGVNFTILPARQPPPMLLISTTPRHALLP